MFYETAQTVGPGWHRSYKPSHYEDMTWSPSNKVFRSPGSSPETYRRIIRNDDDFPSRRKADDEDFFSGRKSPTFPRRVFKEVWNETPSSNHRFSDRPKMFKRVFRPDHSWEDEFDRDLPHLRRVEREFDSNFDGGGPASTKKFDEEFQKRFNARDLKKDLEDEFEKSDGRVHHIPILVERRSDEDQTRSRFRKNEKNSPPEERKNSEDYSDEWTGPQVHRLKKNFEQADDRPFSRFSNHWDDKNDLHSRAKSYFSPASESWDPHAIHTLPTRKAHKSSQSFDDSRHHIPPKYVNRSYSETHEDNPRQQQPHSAAFRSHSDGHCPKQTHVTRIQVNLPSQTEKDELSPPNNQSKNEFVNCNPKPTDYMAKNESPILHSQSDTPPMPKGRNKYDNPSMQQIAVVLQNVEDLVNRINNYNGTGRDKQYRFLDEMLTRCMLRLDDVDTEGREDIRSARKSAVQVVQNCIDKLEAKADESERHCKRSKSRASVKEMESSDTPANEEKAIPVPDKEIPNQLNPNQAIPLPAGPSEKECPTPKNKVIPLSDKPMENEPYCKPTEAIPLSDKPNNEESNKKQNKAIPLGYTPDSTNTQSGENGNTSQMQISTDEQTKL